MFIHNTALKSYVVGHLFFSRKLQIVNCNFGPWYFPQNYCCQPFLLCLQHQSIFFLCSFVLFYKRKWYMCTSVVQLEFSVKYLTKLTEHPLMDAMLTWVFCCWSLWGIPFQLINMFMLICNDALVWIYNDRHYIRNYKRIWQSVLIQHCINESMMHHTHLIT